MKCWFCEEDIPEGSEFCLYCGKRQKEDISTSDVCAATDKGDMEVQLADESLSIHSDKTYEMKHNHLFKIFTIILASLLIAASSVFISQLYSFKEKEDQYMTEIAEKENKLSSKEAEINVLETKNTELTSKIKSLNGQINELEDDSETLQTIISFMQSENAGYASNNFKASNEIFVVNKNFGKTSFTLTCSFSGNTEISTITKGNSASVTFSQNSWYGSTTKLYINPKSTGTTIVTFSNDQNTQIFSILIVVVE